MDNLLPKMVPPDGGWAWFVLFSCCCANFFLKTIITYFVLLFRDLLEELRVDTMTTALITSVYDGICHGCGLFLGPLIRTYSYRKVALVGSILSFIGMALASEARSVVHLFITFSIIQGLGVSMTVWATFVALNSYFLKRKGLAVGLALSGASLGAMLLPHIIRLLLEQYGFRSAILIISGVNLHVFVGSLLLQPVKRHLIQEENKIKKEEYIAVSSKDYDNFKPEDKETKSLMGVILSDGSNDRIVSYPNAPNDLSSNLANAHKTLCSFSYPSIPSEKIFGVELQLPLQHIDKKIPTNNNYRPRAVSLPTCLDCNQNVVLFKPKINIKTSMGKLAESVYYKSKKKESIRQKIVRFLYLELLKQPRYWNLVLIYAIFYSIETNFTVIVPLILDNFGFNRKAIVFSMSAQALGDGLGKLIISPFCDKVPALKRVIFIVSVLLIAVVRSVLVIRRDPVAIIICLGVGGFLRGCAATSYQVLLLEHGSIEDTGAVLGLSLVIKGLTVIIIGPFLGFVRDFSKSYPICVYSQNVLLILCSTSWLIEYVLDWLKSKRRRIKI